ncbi:hypothetical protein RM555_30130 [Micromonospora sp. DSM 115977]|uniref:Uncharacterized protein n=1 Tax=Micromonospora reichwaldensis TaxID=3075516 RepID=A0ABU2X690_9ACTN|nr:hypothetical protein [Micromonospora sp. DSM 115977]MDT0533255.1 hypothetical protein [Micromonospora sp. DSM 115977]
MTDEPSEPGALPAGRESMRRPPSIVVSMVLLASWWAYTLAVVVALLGEVGGAGNWLALACCTAAAAAVLRGLWHGGPTAWRVVHGFAAPVAVAFLVGAGIMLLFGPRLGSLITPPVDPALIATAAGGLLAVLALLASGLLVRTAPARAWCGGR